MTEQQQTPATADRPVETAVEPSVATIDAARPEPADVTATAEPGTTEATATAGPGTAEGLQGAETAAAPQGPVAPKDRRVLRALVRWTAAVTVFAALGAGTAYGITSMERTDVPGLATESDGRWVYPEITRPPLPSGSPSPFDAKNWAQAHYADLRTLLLPAPEGATDDKTLHGVDGWLPTKDFLTVFETEGDRDDVGRLLTDHGLRHTAARGWTTPDGTRTRVYLLQFDTETVSNLVFNRLTSYGAPLHAVEGATAAMFDEAYPTAGDLTDVTRYSYDEAKPYGDEQVRQAYLRAGDVVALVVQSRKGTAAPVPFQQTVTLQSQLLG
ncbi:hypothetical protein [Streptomyces rishiriensis]|uniref:Uncharacterized protein n=1 Tax=Streptomyces rishiriensis TaxID=68264 RepID=A0ABU0NS08_STRRH|nr:hypothetical protein [Streptomyces rishiriensis]MDQ0581887.1 hypothetical protein [Streptomyces rishiriensis]